MVLGSHRNGAALSSRAGNHVIDCSPTLAVKAINGLKALAFDALTLKLTGTTDGFGLFPSTLFRRLLIGFTELHFAEYAFPLHLFLQGF